MQNEIEEKCDKALAKCLDQVAANPDSQKAVHFSQAAQNIAHVKLNLSGVKAPEKPSAKKSD